MIKMIPEAEGGGNPYDSFTYSVREGAYINPKTVSFQVKIECPPGRYSDQTNRICSICPPGTFSSEFSNDPQCSPCLNNTFQDQPGIFPLFPPAPSYLFPHLLSKGQANCTPCPIGTFQDGRGDRTECLSCAEVDYDSSFGCPSAPLQNITSDFSSPSAIILIVLACIVIALCVFVWIVFYLKEETPVVKTASPLFCYLILFGLMLGSASVFFLVGTPSDFTCAIRPFLLALAVSFVLGNLFIKTWRISRIFGYFPLALYLPLYSWLIELSFISATKYSGRKTLISNKSLLFFSAVMLLIELLIPIVWVGVDRPRSTLLSFFLFKLHQKRKPEKKLNRNE